MTALNSHIFAFAAEKNLNLMNHDFVVARVLFFPFQLSAWKSNYSVTEQRLRAYQFHRTSHFIYFFPLIFLFCLPFYFLIKLLARSTELCTTLYGFYVNVSSSRHAALMTSQHSHPSLFFLRGISCYWDNQ